MVESTAKSNQAIIGEVSKFILEMLKMKVIPITTNAPIKFRL